MEAAQNTDRELWRMESPTGLDDAYSPSIHLTKEGKIGINVGGNVHVKDIRRWHQLAEEEMTVGLSQGYSYRPTKAEQISQYLMILFESNRCGHKVDTEIDTALAAYRTEVGI